MIAIADDQLRDHVLKIRTPSENRYHNKSIYVYRLSELIFGSLLASYIIGSVVVFYPNNIENIGISYIIKHLNLTNFSLILTISTSTVFILFTSLIYIIYQKQFMNMSWGRANHLPDFIISISVGIFYGICLVSPILTLPTIALVSYFGTLRHQSLILSANIDWIKPLLPKEERNSHSSSTRSENLYKIIKSLRDQFSKRGKKNQVLSAWRRLTFILPFFENGVYRNIYATFLLLLPILCVFVYFCILYYLGSDAVYDGEDTGAEIAQGIIFGKKLYDEVWVSIILNVFLIIVFVVMLFSQTSFVSSANDPDGVDKLYEELATPEGSTLKKLLPEKPTEPYKIVDSIFHAAIYDAFRSVLKNPENAPEKNDAADVGK